MNHELDYDKDHDREDALDNQFLKQFLQDSLSKEQDMMNKYLMTAERIHQNEELKKKLQNFSEGNAKRSKQLSDELEQMQ